MARTRSKSPARSTRSKSASRKTTESASFPKASREASTSSPAHAPPALPTSEWRVKWDEDLGYNIYKYSQDNKYVKLLADIFSVSGDEIVWFGGPAVIGSSLFCLRGLGLTRPMGCLEESMWDCFGAAATCILVETALKWVFRRTRPTYAPQSKVHSVPCEWFSFPSGHSLRAFYWPFWLSRSKFVKLLAPIVAFPRARYCVPWACGVGWSRIAKGRHFPGDVLVGALIGSALGYVVEDWMTGLGRSLTKTVGGIFVTYAFGITYLIPQVSGDEAAGAISKYGVLYYGFYFLLFFSTLPADWENIGAQTLDAESSCVTIF
ncbi:hypothetical protein TrLO_g13770 [Triparma laevis f. longispina]|uniref:Phosphatidic acid phosphatase type 2/haloperoxidase domain-containing protein n=1 Tax=Triparma laevis f. longispina TaxID=1714387 RepID=A0A9W7E1T0_9STRA|nr:hypothetical protein TrLO_g13770 [Triparma laevis f. longispina]